MSNCDYQPQGSEGPTTDTAQALTRSSASWTTCQGQTCAYQISAFGRILSKVYPSRKRNVTRVKMTSCLSPAAICVWGSSYDTETRFKCARSSFRYWDSLSCVEESLLCQRIAVVLMRAGVSFPWRSCSVGTAFCTD